MVEAKTKQTPQGQSPLINSPIILLRNFDDANSISKVVVDRNSIVVGTMTGKILLFDAKTQRKILEYMAHSRKVTDIWV